MVDTLIDEIIQRESVKDTNNPNDPGGETKYGISKVANPEVWKNGPPTLDQARLVYLQKYITAPGFLQIQPDYLMNQLVDWGVTSGPMLAIMNLQQVLNVPQDGKLGSLTLLTLKQRDPEIVNQQLVKARVLMLGRLVQKRPQQLSDLFGWLNRALSFLRV